MLESVPQRVTIMDKYATLGTLYELKNRRKKRNELKLLRDVLLGEKPSLSLSSPNLSSLSSMGKGGKRSHSITACVSEVTKCALHIIFSSSRDVLELGEHHKPSIPWREATNSGHARDGDTSCVHGNSRLKKNSSVRFDKYCVKEPPPPPKPPELSGTFNSKLITSRLKRVDSYIFSKTFNKLKCNPELDGSCFRKSNSHKCEDTFVRSNVNQCHGSFFNKKLRKKLSVKPINVLYCARVRLRSFSHIIQKLEVKRKDECQRHTRYGQVSTKFHYTVTTNAIPV